MDEPEPKKNPLWEWRFKQFSLLGFSLVVADDLANTRIEIEAARRLVKNGCSLSLVQRILRGTTPFGEDYDDYLTLENPSISRTSEYAAQTATD